LTLFGVRRVAGCSFFIVGLAADFVRGPRAMSFSDVVADVIRQRSASLMVARCARDPHARLIVRS
jgi:hypothetical protein